jgi:hypothetical protein
MASPSASRPTTLELTESETRLRDVLLGAAAYIDEGASAEEKSAAQVPEALAKEKIVCKYMLLGFTQVFCSTINLNNLSPVQDLFVPRRELTADPSAMDWRLGP